MTWLVVHEGALPCKVESQCYTYPTEREAMEEAAELSANGNRYNVFLLVQRHSFVDKVKT